MAQVKTFNDPAYVYRYRSLATPEKLKQELDAIQESYLWFSPFTCLNDPMEGAYDASPLLMGSPSYEDIANRIYDEKTNIGICSFSEVNDHDLMWAHYADQFRGICIRYDFRMMLESLPDDIDMVRLSYNEKIKKVNSRRIKDSNLAKKLLSNKNYHWLYEREWRLLGNYVGIVNLDSKCVKRVYFGRRISSSDRSKFSHILEKVGIDYQVMEINGYSIAFQSPKSPRRGWAKKASSEVS